MWNEDGPLYQSYDYTASMPGNSKGAQKYLQALKGLSISYISCQGHRSNIFIERRLLRCMNFWKLSSMFSVANAASDIIFYVMS